MTLALPMPGNIFLLNNSVKAGYSQYIFLRLLFRTLRATMLQDITGDTALAWHA